MELRTRLAMPPVSGLRNLPFTAGAAVPFSYLIELSPEDATVGVTLVSAELTVRAGFGYPATLIKTITTASTADGQITDDAGTDGHGAFHFDVIGAESTPWTTRQVFDVAVTDSLGRITKFDAGYLVPVTGMEYPYPPVDRVVISPTELVVAMGETGQIAAVAMDDLDNPLVDRIVTRTSSDDAIATVNAEGVITPVSPGLAFITATVEGVSASASLAVTPSPLAGYVVYDSFNRFNAPASLGTGETGHAWVAADGVWGVDGNTAAFISGGTSNNRTALVNAGVSDCTVSVTLAVASGADNPRLVFRATDEANHWLLSGNAFGGYDLFKKIAGAFTAIGAGGAPVTTGDVLSVVLSGNSIDCFVNGASIITASDSYNASATKHGIGCNTGDIDNRWDTFTVTVP